MKRFSYHFSTLVAGIVVAGLGLTAVASATPAPNGAAIIERHFNDCVVTNLATTNLYPGSISFAEDNLLCAGGANLHIWNFSEDGGISSAVFNNVDAFTFGATLVLESNGMGTEGGLRLSPWWDKNANGYFNVRLPDGEIACFGGVLPFYSFTGSHGLHYAAGEEIQLEIVYQPRCNTEEDPATIVYNVVYQGNSYSSGPLPFGNCTPGEEIHGCYGIMDDARAGGRIQNNFFAGGGDPALANAGSFFDIYFELNEPDCPVQTESSTWGRMKGLYR